MDSEFFHNPMDSLSGKMCLIEMIDPICPSSISQDMEKTFIILDSGYRSGDRTGGTFEGRWGRSLHCPAGGYRWASGGGRLQQQVSFPDSGGHACLRTRQSYGFSSVGGKDSGEDERGAAWERKISFSAGGRAESGS